MSRTGYRYALQLIRGDGRSLGQFPATADFDPLREWACFVGIRQDRVAPSTRGSDASVLPLWNDRLGEPYVRGFRISVPPHRGPAGRDLRRRDEPDAGPFSLDVSTELFRSTAEDLSSTLVKEGRLAAGEVFHYLTLAFPVDPEPPRRGAIRVRRVAPPLPLLPGHLDDLLSGSTTIGDADDRDVPVFIPRSLLDEVTALSRQACEEETAGVLAGHLRRDARTPELFVEVTAHLPAAHGEADRHRFSFTPRTWTAAREMLTRRDRDELMLGWSHSHPLHAWCASCPAEKRQSCLLARGFLSEDDRLLHRTVFPAAYSVALVVNDAGPGRVSHSLFGWREGEIVARGFHVLEDTGAVHEHASPVHADAPSAHADTPSVHPDAPPVHDETTSVAVHHDHGDHGCDAGARRGAKRDAT